MIKFLIPIVYIFVHNRFILDSLANFNLWQTELIFWSFISENLWPPLIFLVPSLGENWRKWRHFLKNTTWVESVITVSTAIHKKNKNSDSYISAIFYINKLVLRFQLMQHFEKVGTRKINGGHKFSEIKVQKLQVLMFITDWNLSRYLGNTYCVWKCKKSGYQEFHQWHFNWIMCMSQVWSHNLIWIHCWCNCRLWNFSVGGYWLRQ